MLFNSIEFFIFFPVVLVLFYMLPHRFRWILLLLSSYYFYMDWNPIYASLIVFTTTIDFYVSNRMQRHSEKSKRRPWLLMSLFFNLGLLMYFKYYNFFIDNINFLSGSELKYMQFLLPLGISFYTFQSMGYVIDVYRGEMKAVRHWGKFALFVAYFPQLVAGPIERAKNLIHQLDNKVIFNYRNFVLGGQHIIWGLFKKLVIADNLAFIVDVVYGDSGSFSAGWLALATYCFAIQIYCDFSGYSDIAIGVAKCMGVDLMVNFRLPYLSKGIREFWSRWHISLSTWFRDYVYIPLGGNRISPARTTLNLLLVFVISGFWHGAAWTFIIWGFLHAIYLLIELMLAKTSWWVPYLAKRKGPGHWIGVFILFHLVTFAWIFFRSDTVHQALQIISDIFTFKGGNGELPYEILFLGTLGLCFKIFLGTLFILFDSRMNQIIRGEKILVGYKTKLVLYGFILASIFLFGSWGEVSFIYFQF